MRPPKGSKASRLYEQVKQLRGKRLTLRSADALEAIANLCQHRSSKPGEKLSFRFLTTTSPSKERQWGGSDNGIVTWEKVRNGKILGNARKSGISEIKAFLRNCAAKVPKGVRKSFVEAVSGDDNQFADVIDAFELFDDGAVELIAAAQEIPADALLRKQLRERDEDRKRDDGDRSTAHNHQQNASTQGPALQMRRQPP